MTLTKIRQELLKYLELLETKYGELPSLLATKADYETDLYEQIRLLQKAYDLAKAADDRANVTLIASSLVELFAEEAKDPLLAQQWLGPLADAIGEKWNDVEHKEYKSLVAQVERLKDDSHSDVSG